MTGLAAVDRDFLDVLSDRLPYALGLVLLLTMLLLTRAFRSIVLPLKAVVLNLLSLAASFGVVVLVFQHGYGSSLWDVQAAESVTAWIPVMIFAFLFGLTMDYEVFMLSRMREAYDETGSTDRAIELGLARTGKLVTSAALILMFAFLVLSTSPGYEIKPLAIGIAAGIMIDATIIRALLVPALMRLMGAGELVDAGAAAPAPRRHRPVTLNAQMPQGWLLWRRASAALRAARRSATRGSSRSRRSCASVSRSARAAPRSAGVSLASRSTCMGDLREPFIAVLSSRWTRAYADPLSGGRGRGASGHPSPPHRCGP